MADQNLILAPDEEGEVASKKDDDAILKDGIAFLAARIEAEADMRKDALDDLKFVTGEQWPPEVAEARKRDNRPCLRINKMVAFLHQVTNDQRQNRPSIKVHPVDDNADVATSDVFQGLIRYVEQASNADIAYDTAVNSAAAIGFGYWRLVPGYESDDSFDQVIKFKRIRNAFTVYLGPHEEPDGSDMMKAMITEEMEKAEFKRQYPGKDCDDTLARGMGDGVKQWLSKEKVRIAEFYRVEMTPAKLVRVKGKAVYEDEMEKGQKPDLDPKTKKPITRDGHKRKVCWYKMTGVEVLDRTDIACNWIPIFPVYGDEFDVDGKIVRSGLIRNAKEPAQMYNVWMTAATEEIGLRPKAPYIGAEGFAEGHEAKWNSANVRSWPYIEYKPTELDGNLAPPPQRQPMADIPAGVLAMAMHASDDIKATTGIFDASLGARSNETSGRAITARQKESDVSNFHFQDGLMRAIRQCARCLVWMIPRYYDTERAVRIIGEDEEVSHVQVNRPMSRQEVQQQKQEAAQQAQQQPDAKAKAIQTVEHDLTVGTYDITVASGPSYTTQRQETADALIQFGQSWPQLFASAGDLIVKNFDWHGADQIAERLKRTLPPGIAQDDDDEPVPAKAMAQIQELSQAKDQLSHALEQAHSEHMDLENQVKAGTQAKMIQAQTQQQIDQQKHQRDIEFEKVKAQQAMEDNHAKFAIVQLQTESAWKIARLNAEVTLQGQMATAQSAQQALEADQVLEGQKIAAGTESNDKKLAVDMHKHDTGLQAQDMSQDKQLQAADQSQTKQLDAAKETATIAAKAKPKPK